MGTIAKQSIQGTIVTYIGVAIGFVTTFFVLTRYLSPEEIGLSRVLVDAATLFIGLAQLGTNNSIIRFFPYFKGGKERLFFRIAMIVPLVGFGLISLVYIFCHQPLSQWFGEKSPLFVSYYYAVLPLSFFMLYQGVFDVCCNVRMKIVVPRAVREIGTRVLLLVVYLLYAGKVLSIDGFVGGICTAYALCALVDGIYYLYIESHRRTDDCKKELQAGIWRKMIRYMAFLVVSSLTGTLAPLLSGFFITAQMGLNYTGIFAIASYMAVMVSIPYRSLTAIASPLLAQAIQQQDRVQATRLMQQASNNLLLIGGIILMTIWINIDLIFTLLPNGESYEAARYVVLILGLSQLVSATYNICLSALNFSGYYAFSLLWSLVLTVTSILLNNYLIPLYGMNGAAISSLVSMLIYFVLIVLTVRITTGTHPVSTQQIRSALLIITIFILNYLLRNFVPMGLWLGSIVRTILLIGGMAATAYALNLSPELNAILRKIFIQRK